MSMADLEFLINAFKTLYMWNEINKRKVKFKYIYETRFLNFWSIVLIWKWELHFSANSS